MDFSVGVGAFVIGLGQISSFFSSYLANARGIRMPFTASIES